MKVIQAYVKGWSSIFRNKRLLLLMYLVNFVLALCSTIPVSGLLGRSLKYSVAFEQNQSGFDYTFFSEMYKRFEDQINGILDQTILFVALFLLASVFLIGGALNIFKASEEGFRFKTFWEGASKYFWRLLRLTIYFLLLHGGVLCFFFLLFSLISGGLNPFEIDSEKQWIDATMILLPIYVLVFTLISMIQDYAKIQLVDQDPPLLFGTFWGSFQLVLKNIGKFFFLYLLNILTFFFCFGIYYWLSDQFDQTTMGSIFLFFLLGQIFILTRISIKLVNLSSATYLYQWTREGYIK